MIKHLGICALSCIAILTTTTSSSFAAAQNNFAVRIYETTTNNDGYPFLSIPVTATKTITALNDLLAQMQELAVNAANGTNGWHDLELLDNKFQEKKHLINLLMQDRNAGFDDEYTTIEVNNILNKQHYAFKPLAYTLDILPVVSGTDITSIENAKNAEANVIKAISMLDGLLPASENTKDLEKFSDLAPLDKVKDSKSFYELRDINSFNSSGKIISELVKLHDRYNEPLSAMLDLAKKVIDNQITDPRVLAELDTSYQAEMTEAYRIFSVTHSIGNFAVFGNAVLSFPYDNQAKYYELPILDMKKLGVIDDSLTSTTNAMTAISHVAKAQSYITHWILTGKDTEMSNEVSKHKKVLN